jgi:hypothetical protein
MTVNKPQHCSVVCRNRAFGVLIFFTCTLPFVGGCSGRSAPTRSWRGAGLFRPTVPVNVSPHPKPLAEDRADPVPDLRLEIPPPPPLLAVHSLPPRPHVAPPPSAEANTASKPEVPIIAPQLTPAETSAAQQQMTSSLSIAEKNLARSQGKRLNATQTDLAAKIRGFISDARTAGREGDWTRARSLATKAQVLSEELAASL